MRSERFFSEMLATLISTDEFCVGSVAKTLMCVCVLEVLAIEIERNDIETVRFQTVTMNEHIVVERQTLTNVK